MNKDYLIMDLDGTLLFGEERPGAFMVPGRRRHSYMARETIELLRQIQEKRHIVLATGRSRLSALFIINGLREQGLVIHGAAAENGGIWIDSRDECECFVDLAWIDHAKMIETSLPELIQAEFESCVALLNPQASDLIALDNTIEGLALEHRRLKDGNKLFILALEVDKKHALERVLGYASLHSAWGIGNDLNDLDWMKEVDVSAAPACARDELLLTVKQNRGYISEQGGHAGIADILSTLGGI